MQEDISVKALGCRSVDQLDSHMNYITLYSIDRFIWKDTLQRKESSLAKGGTWLLTSLQGGACEGTRWSSGINAANGARGPRFASLILPTVQRPWTSR